MSESEIFDSLRPDDLNPELDADPDEGELRDLGLAGGSDQGLSGCTTQSGSGSGGNEATMEEAVTSFDPLGDGNDESAMDMFWKHEMEFGKEENRSKLDVYLKEDLEKKRWRF
ncbi:hypothetical protein COLO4_30188 [Corchorus olitorius]|uniref:Uncharacterized protein n=1 Tax=Corchorus olitorius TaxID=93759 RepID=A0A1R3HAB1_9ROSI|nr:hypothetical protein COLO4_30188 [Corchorus olitorius]